MPTEFISLRKDQLRLKISEAIEHNANHEISNLKAKWVHRYGIESLEEIDKKEEQKFIALNDLEVDDSVLELSMDEPKIIDEEMVEWNDEKTFLQQQHTQYFNNGFSNDSEEKEGSRLISVSSIDSSPPPIPQIHHFRRWLYSKDDSMPNAS